MAKRRCTRRRFWAVRLHSSRPAHIVEVPAGQFLQLSRACVSEGTKARLQVSVEAPATAGHGSGAFNFAFLIEEGGRNLSLRLPRGYAWQLKLINKGPVLTSSAVDVLGYVTPSGGSGRGARRTIQDSPRRHSSLRQVRLPAGWTALSFKSTSDGRLVVTDVPKACFSSRDFGAAAAPQVANVAVGDEIVDVNGFSLASLAKCIMSPGCQFNTCNEHVPGSVGKLQSPPCISCDFIRRRREFGLDLALQMWLRVVKQDMSITLGVRRPRDHSESRLHPERSQATQAPVASREEIRAEAPKAMPKAAAEVQTTSEAQAPPVPLRRGYNPLKPAATGAVSTSPKARQGPLRGDLTQLAGGLCYEELPPKGGVVLGVEQTALGREVEFRFDISSKGSKTKVVERGQVRFVLGAADLKDGWVDGHVNLEEVLSAWAPAMLGMRAGQRRRVLVPGRLGFRDGSEVLAANADLSVDIELKQLG